MVHCHVWIPHPEKLAEGQFKKTMAWMAYCHERRHESNGFQSDHARGWVTAMVWRYLEMFFAQERLGEHVHHWQNRHHLAATGFSKVCGRCWAAQVVLEPVSDVLSVSSHLQSGDRAIEPGIGKWWIIMKWSFCHMVKNVLRMFIANLIDAYNHEKRLDTHNTTDDLRHRCINTKTTHTKNVLYSMWYPQKGLGVLQETWNNDTRWIQRDIIVPLGSAISINTWVWLKIVGKRYKTAKTWPWENSCPFQHGHELEVYMSPFVLWS